ncbi:MAG: membrane protein insertase YidC, partial [Candidatus Thiodiazotropha sp.]
MDNLRLILFFILAFVGLLLYQAWQQDYGPQSQTQPQTADAPGPGMTEDSAAVPTVEVKAELPAAAAPEGAESSAKSPRAAVIKVETDLLMLEISTRGGTVQKAQLLDYPVSLDHPELKVELLTPREPDIYIAQSGLIGTEEGKAPSHEAIYQAQQASYRLADGSDELVVPLTW